MRFITQLVAIRQVNQDEQGLDRNSMFPNKAAKMETKPSNFVPLLVSPYPLALKFVCKPCHSEV